MWLGWEIGVEYRVFYTPGVLKVVKNLNSFLKKMKIELKRSFLVGIILISSSASQFFLKTASSENNHNQTKISKGINNMDLESFEESGKWGYRDKSGNVIIKPQFSLEAGNFSEGLASVGVRREKEVYGRPNFQYGYIDQTGKFVIPPKFDFAGDFKNGLAEIREGKEFTQNIFEKTVSFFRNMIPVIGGTTPGKNVPGKYGCIDNKGDYVIKPIFDYMGNFENEKALAQIGKKWGYVDKKGDFIIKFKAKFDKFEQFSTPFAKGVAKVQSDEKWGYIDESGDFTIKPRFNVIGEFVEGLAPAKIGKKWGYIDLRGNTTIDFKFDEAEFFSGGFARVMLGDEQQFISKWGYIDNKGSFLIEPKFLSATDFQGGFAIVGLPVSNGNRNVAGRPLEQFKPSFGIIDKTGGFVLEPKYDSIAPTIRGDYYTVKMRPNPQNENIYYFDPKTRKLTDKKELKK